MARSRQLAKEADDLGKPPALHFLGNLEHVGVEADRGHLEERSIADAFDVDRPNSLFARTAAAASSSRGIPRLRATFIAVPAGRIPRAVDVPSSSNASDRTVPSPRATATTS
jgi:hypothetical protein